MKKIAAFLGLTILIASCTSGNTRSIESNNRIKEELKNGGDERSNVIEFKVNKQPVSTSGWTISRFAWENDPTHQWLNITSNMHDEKRTINVNLDGTVPGEYYFTDIENLQKRSHGSFFPDYMGNMTNSYSFTSGMFKITEVDTIRRVINGSFSGTVKNLKGETLEITEGQIVNGTLNQGVTRY